MTEPTKIDRRRQPRDQKQDLESRSFRDGAIYLFRRGDYKKPTWFCRVKVPRAKGYLSCSTKTTDEHEAFKFADDLFLKSLGRVTAGQDLRSRRVNKESMTTKSTSMRRKAIARVSKTKRNSSSESKRFLRLIACKK